MSVVGWVSETAASDVTSTSARSPAGPGSSAASVVSVAYCRAVGSAGSTSEHRGSSSVAR